jgi:hypothetical protein
MKLSEFPLFKKERATDVQPYGEQITTRGGYVWCAYSHGQRIVTAATVKECRRKYWAQWHAEWAAAGFVRS